MENFFTDTPFGISILGGLIAMIGGGILMALLKNNRASLHQHWILLVLRFLGYGSMMVIITYLDILIWYILIALLGTAGLSLGSFAYLLLLMLWLLSVIYGYWLTFRRQLCVPQNT